MNWYLTKIVFRIVCGEGKHTPQFDEQLRVIAADNKEEAFYKARAIGKDEEEFFKGTLDEPTLDERIASKLSMYT